MTLSHARRSKKIRLREKINRYYLQVLWLTSPVAYKSCGLQVLRAGLPTCHLRLIARLAQRVAPRLPAVPEFKPLGPTDRTGDFLVNSPCCLLAAEALHEL